MKLMGTEKTQEGDFCSSDCSQSCIHDWVATSSGDYVIECIRCGKREKVEERESNPDYIPSDMW